MNQFMRNSALGALVTAMLAMPAYAQSADAGAAAPQYDEIIVTAQKREQKLSDVGMAITAVSGEMLATKGVLAVEDLVKVEPSLQYTKSSNGPPVYSIRGVGFYDQSLASAPAVSLYLDEQPFSFSALSKGAMLDVQRVEVLKGPQGTLYGQNATGGAINFIAAKPTDQFAAGADASIGRFNATSVGGFVSGPLGDTLRARLAFQIDQGGAWQRSNTRDDKLGDKDLKTGRLLLNWAPTSDFTATLNLNGFLNRSESQAGQFAGTRLQGPEYITASLVAMGPGVANYLLTHPLAFLPAAPGSADYASYPAAIKARLVSPSPNKPRAADWLAGTHPKLHENYYQATLRLEYSLSDTIGVTSLTKYENYRQNNQIDLGGVNALALTADIYGKVDSVAQELRLHGSFDDKRAEWVLGVNYAHDKAFEDANEPTTSSGTFLTGGAVGSVPLPPPFNVPFPNFEVIHYSTTKTASIFANLEYKLSDQFSVHGGIRYTNVVGTAASCAQVDSAGLSLILASISSALAGSPQAPIAPGACNTFLPNGTQGLYRTRQKEHNIPWRVGVDWKLSPNNLLYATISKGYKAGGSPALGATAWQQLIPITQESLLAYEVGFKLSMLDRTLHANGSLFYYDYSNKQLLGRIPDPNGIFGAQLSLVNIPKSRETGAELSVDWTPVKGLTLSGSATYLDAKVTSHFINYGPYPTGVSDTLDFYGQSFPYTPKWSLSAGARYEWPVGERLNAWVSANGSYQTGSISTFGAKEVTPGLPRLEIPAYGLLDLAAGLDTADGHWRFQVFGKNVTNKYYITNIFYQIDSVVKYSGMPATYGLSARYRY